MIERILIVCVGNICRSPMAEGLLRQMLGENSLGDIEVYSAGLAAMVGCPADPIARELMSELDIDISAHRARQLGGELCQWADLILTMEQSHSDALLTTHPGSRGKVFLLGQWSSTDITDPYRLPRDAFEYSLELIRHGVESWVYKLQ